MMAFVEPPHACRTRIAFLKAAGVNIFEGIISSLTIFTISRPELNAETFRAGLFSGITEVPGSVNPSASTIIATEDAVPIVLQEPNPQFKQPSNSFQVSSLIFFAR